MKYHFSDRHAVFFFHYRKNERGIQFYITISQQDLLLLIQNQECLLKKDTNILFMKNKDIIEPIPFNYDNEKFKDYLWHGYEKWINSSYYELVFELTRDLADPTFDYFPFLYFEKVNEMRFEIYLCFMNVEKAGEYLVEKKQKELKNED